MKNQYRKYVNSELHLVSQCSTLCLIRQEGYTLVTSRYSPEMDIIYIYWGLYIKKK